MTTAEIIKLENENENSIFLIKKGCFWRVYEKSAFRFVNLIRKFQITKKYIKCVNQEIVYLGFPLTLWLEIEKEIVDLNLGILEKTEDLIVLGKCLDEISFEEWKVSLKSTLITDNHLIIESLRCFPTINKTPLEAMQFILQLQTEIITKS